MQRRNAPPGTGRVTVGYMSLTATAPPQQPHHSDAGEAARRINSGSGGGAN